MRVIHKFFYREKGIRYPDRLLTGNDAKFDVFPRSALFHYVPMEGESPDCDTSSLYFQGYSKKILLDYVVDYSKPEGAFRKPMFALKEMTRSWRQANKSRWEFLPSAWKDNHNPETLVVFNYGYLDVIHKYIPVQMAAYHQWYNRQRTVWDRAAEIAKSSERHQFLYFPVPAVLQGRTILDKYAAEASGLRMATIFGEHGWAGFMQLDMWRFLSEENRNKSLISAIDPKHYPKINLVFIGASGSPMILNLGYLNSWIKGQPNQTEFGSIVQYEALYVRKLFLKMCMTLNAMTVEENSEGEVVIPTTPLFPAKKPITKLEQSDPAIQDDSEDETVETPGDLRETTETEAFDLPEDEFDEESEVSHGPSELKAGLSSKTSPKMNEFVDPNKIESTSMPILSNAVMDDLEKDMDMLDKLSLVHLKNAGIKLNEAEGAEQPPVIDPEVVRAQVYQDKTPGQILTQWMVEDADANLITASDYRKLKETVEKYNASEDPYGSKKPRVEAMKIVPEDIILTKEESSLVVSDSVQDKSMANARLSMFDKKYIRSVQKKDILNAVDSVQAAGVTIRRHEIDVEHSAMGSYEKHTLEIKPIDGAPSTIQFTLPQIDEDGTFLAGGNKYILRKQRVDNPLRKIASRIVALSTYYGKTFVQTNPKVVNDETAWLYRQINLSAFSQEAFIRDVNPGNVFDNDLKAPYIYNALAAEYEQFKAGTMLLNFSRKHALKTVNPELLKIIEKNGRLWCGWTANKEPIVVDRSNNFFVVNKEGEKPLGGIYDVLRLDTAKKPLDIAEVRVFSKYIPVGIVLAYYIGLNGLIALLGVNYRTVEGRKQKSLEKDEYAITFKDETLIFKSTNPASTMILNGFNDYEKMLKQYDRKMFDHKDVYLNLLMAKKMGAVYVRELDMMENAFVDPISKEILQDMNEPVTFKGLLVRSCVLLTTFDHPASQDRSVMRDRGYERFAGAVYKELMQATRQFRNKNLVGRAKIDMSPYQVWNAIMKDSALKIVEDTNPIQNLKESEVITYAGTGGRDKDSMTKASRAYHKSDLGILSESTVDSSAVGTIAYLSANPNIKNIRGVASEDKELTPTSIVSTSALVSPCSSNDN